MKPWNLKQLSLDGPDRLDDLDRPCVSVSDGWIDRFGRHSQSRASSGNSHRSGAARIASSGAALGSAGVAYQAILQNPLADPYLLSESVRRIAGGISLEISNSQRWCFRRTRFGT